MRHRLLSLMILLACCIPVVPAAGQLAPAAADSAVAQHRLRAGDAVRLMVHNEPDLAGEYPVLEDGTVLLPLIGLIPMAGVPFGDVLRQVRAAYAAELVGATIVLQPLVRVRVLGEVREPGLYLVDATFGLRDVLAQAGGLSPSAAPGRVQLIRNGTTELFDLDSSAAWSRGMLPGDEVVVPRRGWVRENLPILIGAGTSVMAAALTALLIR